MLQTRFVLELRSEIKQLLAKNTHQQLFKWIIPDIPNTFHQLRHPAGYAKVLGNAAHYGRKGLNIVLAARSRGKTCVTDE